jgi:hypothetical protein
VRQHFFSSFLALSFALIASSVGAEKPAKVERACGKLMFGKTIYDKKSGLPTDREFKPISRGIIILYPRTDSSECCISLQPIVQTKTEGEGEFNLKKLTQGDYWLVASVHGSDYKLPLQYRPDEDLQLNCSEYFYVIENGAFELVKHVLLTSNPLHPPERPVGLNR